MAYLLYGNDIGEETTPIEAGAAWTVNFEKGDFMGRAPLQRQTQQGRSVDSWHSNYCRNRCLVMDSAFLILHRPNLLEKSPVGIFRLSFRRESD